MTLMETEQCIALLLDIVIVGFAIFFSCRLARHAEKLILICTELCTIGTALLALAYYRENQYPSNRHVGILYSIVHEWPDKMPNFWKFW